MKMVLICVLVVFFDDVNELFSGGRYKRVIKYFKLKGRNLVL